MVTKGHFHKHKLNHIYLPPWTFRSRTSPKLSRPGPRGNPWRNMKVRRPSSRSPSTTSSETFLNGFTQKHSMYIISHAGSLGQQRRASRNWQEPALKLLAPRQQPIRSLGQPAIIQTHLQPVTQGSHESYFDDAASAAVPDSWQVDCRSKNTETESKN